MRESDERPRITRALPSAAQVASTAGMSLGLGLIFVGALRLLAGDSVTALWCVAAGWLLKDATRATQDRWRRHEALRGLTVRDAMLTDVATIPGYLAVSDLKRESYLRGGYHSYPVVRGERLVGLLSVRAAMALSPEERERTSVQAVMTRIEEDIVVGPGEPLLGAMARMARSGVGRLLVVEDGHLQGLLSLSVVLRRGPRLASP